MAARPYVQKLLDAGTPRALIAILFLMSYMSDFASCLQRSKNNNSNICTNDARPKRDNTCLSQDKTLGDLDVLEIFAGIGATRRMNNPMLPAVLHGLKQTSNPEALAHVAPPP